MDEKDVKEVQKEVLNSLEKLADTPATFLFLGGDAHCFTVHGSSNQIKTELTFAMLRYPVIREIFEDIMDNIETLDKLYGEDIRKAELDHSIERYGRIPRSMGDA